MFQSFKKWVKNEDPQDRSAPPFGMQTMRSDLQKKFAKGVQYSLKIVIRGDRNTGKTCLWHRLRGHKFVEEYIPTAEIQVASIQWDYKATDDVVKVDVWDVVDKGKSRKKESKGLKLSLEDEEPDEQVLDASFLDVYKNTHAVIMTFDITKKWTFKYIEKELPKVPTHIPVLILANFRDMGDHRVISHYEVEGLITYSDRQLTYYMPTVQGAIPQVPRPPGSPSVMFSESSMKNGYGLKFIHKFFNMPFLLVQRETLLKQLETNHLDLESCVEELSTEEHGYDMFIQRRQEAMNMKVTNQTPNTPQSTQNSSTNGTNSPAAQTPPQSSTAPASSNKQTEKPSLPKNDIPSPGGKDGGLFSPSQMENQTPTAPKTEPEKRGFMSRFFRRSSTEPSGTVKDAQAASKPDKNNDAKPKPTPKPVTNVEEFVPEDDSVDDFLNEDSDVKVKNVDSHPMQSSDEDDDNGNPMVAGFQEDLDSDDQIGPTYKQTVYSSSDSEPEKFKTIAKPKQNIVKTPSNEDTIRVEKKISDTTAQDFSDSDEEDVPRPEITKDADFSSDDSDDEKPTVKQVEKSTQNKFETVQKDVTQIKSDISANRNLKGMPEIQGDGSGSGSDDDDELKTTAMVSTGYDDISSNDEAKTPQPPVAIVTPLQAERNFSFGDGDGNNTPEMKPTSQGLHLELDSADLDFLEQTTKRHGSASSDTRRDSKEGRSHKSKKSSSNKKDDDNNDSSKKSHRKHKKHRSKETDECEKDSRSSRSHRSKDDKEGRKKKRSKKPNEQQEGKNADDDLEAFLNAM